MKLAILIVLQATPVFAGWTVINLNPAGTSYSYAWGVSGNTQVGVSGSIRAGLWSGTASSWIDLDPTGGGTSWVFGVSGNQRVGYASDGVQSHAVLWDRTMPNRIDLNPTGAYNSYAFGVSDNQQVGRAHFDSNYNVYHAGLWRGAASSWIDLNPDEAEYSEARGVSGGQQVGWASINGLPHPGIWHGTAESWVELASFGYAYATSGDQQVGVTYGASRYASLWSGSAESLVNLNPAGANASEAKGVSGGFQVGHADFTTAGYNRAGIWHGTAESWTDLHSLLPSNTYQSSEAVGISVVGEEIWVVGAAHPFENLANPYTSRAMLWHYTPNPVPEPSCMIVLTGSLAIFGIIRRSKL